MILIDECAEERLLAFLENMKNKIEAPRCLHLHNQEQQVAMDRVIRAVENILPPTHYDERDLQGYFCTDGDVFIVSQRFLPSQARGIANLLDLQQGELYELVHGWRPLLKIVDEKVQRIRDAEQEKLKKLATQKQEKLRENILKADVNHEMVGSLSKRRAAHETAYAFVVEDDSFSRRLVRNALNDRTNLTMISEGRFLAELYVEKAPHIIFLDIDLPDVSGLELLQMLKSIDPNAFVVMLSGNGDRQNVMKAIDLGAKGFIGKPFSKEKLINYLKRATSL